MKFLQRRLLFRVMALMGICFCALSEGSASGQETGGRKYAILVGVREYDRNQLKNLPYAENDVVELADILKQAGFRRVVLMTQTEGAKSARALPLAKTVREALKGVLEDRTKDDLVLVAFAGHGVQFKGEKENYFCPMDAVLTDRSTLISLTEVYKQLEQSSAGTKLLLVDACRNDPLVRNARAAGDVERDSVTRPQLPDPPGGVAAFFSCSAGQRAFDDESLKHGVFFHHVILGLRGAARLNKRDEVTWDSLIAYVKAEVPDAVKERIGNTIRQIPENKGELRRGAQLVSLPSEALLVARNLFSQGDWQAAISQYSRLIDADHNSANLLAERAVARHLLYEEQYWSGEIGPDSEREKVAEYRLSQRAYVDADLDRASALEPSSPAIVSCKIILRPEKTSATTSTIDDSTPRSALMLLADSLATPRTVAPRGLRHQVVIMLDPAADLPELSRGFREKLLKRLEGLSDDDFMKSIERLEPEFKTEVRRTMGLDLSDEELQTFLKKAMEKRKDQMKGQLSSLIANARFHADQEWVKGAYYILLMEHFAPGIGFLDFDRPLIGDDDLMISLSNRSIEASPKSILGYLCRGYARLQIGKNREAVNDFNEAIRLRPGGYYPFELRGQAYSKLGDTAAGERDSNRASEIKKEIVRRIESGP